MRNNLAVAVVIAVVLIAGAVSGPAEPLAATPVVDNYLDELVDVEFTLELPARATATQALHGSLRVANVGPITCVVALDLRPGDGAVRIDWRGPDRDDAVSGGG